MLFSLKHSDAWSFLLCLFILLLYPSISQTEEKLTRQSQFSSPSDSLIPPPANMALYKRKLSSLNPAQRMRVEIHGLRLAPLHPEIWGIRRVDRTENRRIVPIKPYYLRQSLSPDFILEEVLITFSFREVKRRHMLRWPEQRAPVFDIGFNGSYHKGAPGARALLDQEYVLRLTAFPPLASGILYRSHTSYLPLVTAAEKHIETGKNHSLQMLFDGSKLRVILNGQPFAELNGSYQRGLFSMITSWHPLQVEQLTITGIDNSSEAPIRVELSGLIREEE